MWICKNEKFCLLQLLEIIIRLLLERKEKWTYLRSLGAYVNTFNLCYINA